MKAFIYARVSTTDQEYSPDAQVNQCRAYCVAKGYDVAAVFVDKGVSGSISILKRPAGAEMFSRLAETDALVFAKIDRAFRDTVDCLVTVAEVREAGKAIHFLDLGVDTTTAAGELCLTMMGALARFERRRISDRIKESLTVARSKGVKTTPPPFGYRWGTHGEHVVDLKEFQVLQQIRELGECNLPANEIARMLNKSGKRTREGKMFTHVQVLRALKRSDRLNYLTFPVSPPTLRLSSKASNFVNK